MARLRTLDDLPVEGKTVLVRVDLNVPMKQGKVEDGTRIARLIPTLEHLLKRNAKVVVLSHFGRPEGEFSREFSLAPLTNPLSEALNGKEIKFALDCIGPKAHEAVKALLPGEILLLENVRFHKGEEANNNKFASELASLGDFYVNDAFACSHRKHASITGVAKLLPSAAGLLLQEELQNLERVLEHPERPIAAIVGGSKVSTKLALLEHLVCKVDLLAIGGAMANTFLKAKGVSIGKSLYESELIDTALTILERAEKAKCEIFLPTDVVVAKDLKERGECQIVSVLEVPKDKMILDFGPESITLLAARLSAMKSVVWNGPLGAFEVRPYDVGTLTLARHVAFLSTKKKLISVAGGGDVVAALRIGGITESFTYISTAGGAFLEWLEGKELPGVAALRENQKSVKARAS